MDKDTHYIKEEIANIIIESMVTEETDLSIIGERIYSSRNIIIIDFPLSKCRLHVSDFNYDTEDKVIIAKLLDGKSCHITYDSISINMV